MKAILITSIVATLALNAFPQDFVSDVVWECGTPTQIVLHDAGGISERFKESLPGGGWNFGAASAAAAANFHGSIRCAQDTCEDPASISCIKIITTTYDSLIPLGQDPTTGEFMYKIRGLKVTGVCGVCISAGE